MVKADEGDHRGGQPHQTTDAGEVFAVEAAAVPIVVQVAHQAGQHRQRPAAEQPQKVDDRQDHRQPPLLAAAAVDRAVTEAPQQVAAGDGDPGQDGGREPGVAGHPVKGDAPEDILHKSQHQIDDHDTDDDANESAEATFKIAH